MEKLDRGVTVLNGQGVYSGEQRPTLYVVVTPNELHELKELVSSVDPHAFMTSFSVNEAAGEGFTYSRPKRHLLKKKK